MNRISKLALTLICLATTHCQLSADLLVDNATLSIKSLDGKTTTFDVTMPLQNHIDKNNNTIKITNGITELLPDDQSPENDSYKSIVINAELHDDDTKVSLTGDEVARLYYNPSCPIKVLKATYSANNTNKDISMLIGLIIEKNKGDIVIKPNEFLNTVWKGVDFAPNDEKTINITLSVHGKETVLPPAKDSEGVSYILPKLQVIKAQTNQTDISKALQAHITNRFGIVDIRPKKNSKAGNNTTHVTLKFDGKKTFELSGDDSIGLYCNPFNPVTVNIAWYRTYEERTYPPISYHNEPMHQKVTSVEPALQRLLDDNDGTITIPPMQLTDMLCDGVDPAPNRPKQLMAKIAYMGKERTVIGTDATGFSYAPELIVLKATYAGVDVTQALQTHINKIGGKIDIPAGKLTEVLNSGIDPAPNVNKKITASLNQNINLTGDDCTGIYFNPFSHLFRVVSAYYKNTSGDSIDVKCSLQRYVDTYHSGYDTIQIAPMQLFSTLYNGVDPFVGQQGMFIITMLGLQGNFVTASTTNLAGFVWDPNIASWGDNSKKTQEEPAPSRPIDKINNAFSSFASQTRKTFRIK